MIEDIWHFLQTEERSKGGRDRKVETVLMSRMEGLMDRDRQPGRIMRWKARLLLEMDRYAMDSTQTRCWERWPRLTTWISELKGSSLIPESVS